MIQGKYFLNHCWILCSYRPDMFVINYYTQCTVKLRPNFQKIAQLKCTTNEKRNLTEHDEKFQIEKFLVIYRKSSLDSIFWSIYRVKTVFK